MKCVMRPVILYNEFKKNGVLVHNITFKKMRSEKNAISFEKKKWKK